MSFYGATTPTVQDEDFNRERAALTDVEREKLQCELYGFPEDEDADAIQETPTFISNSLKLLQDAIDSLSYEEKSAYILAKERVPELIEEESPPVAYLRCESFDAWAAAKRLCGYWTLRTQFFGQDLAFLPMTLDGAMRENCDDLEKLSFVFPVDDDINGRIVLYWDRMRASLTSRESILRCVMYVCTIQSFRPEFSVKGYIVLGNYQNCDLRKGYDRALTKGMTGIVYTTGAKMKAFHLCTGPGRSVAGLLLPVIRKIVGYYIRLRFIVHSGCGSDLLPYFEDYGLNETHIQVMYGPLRNKLATVQSWISRQQKFEQSA